MNDEWLIKAEAKAKGTEVAVPEKIKGKSEK